MEEPSGMYHELEDSMGGMYPGPSSNLQASLLLVTTVDIGEGKSDRIEVRRGDVPMDVARDFVIKHGLPPAIIPRLAMHLEENLAKVAAQKQQAANRGGKSIGGFDDNGDEVAVFHRLYEQAIALRQKLDVKRDMIKRSEEEAIRQSKTNMSWISSEMMRDRSSGPFENYGEMLYAESLESMARRREKAERRKAEKQMEEVQGVTFKPEISRLAQNLWNPHECSQVPAWQRLSKVKMTKAQERLEMLRREKEEAEVKECTFKPQLNHRSERLMTERSQTLRSLNVSAHQQLYLDAVRRQQKMQDYQHWYPEEVTFQPKLHESAMAREFLRKSLGPEAAMLSATGEERHKALVNRLYASYEKLQNKLQEARSTLQTSIDPATGKKLFHPETGRAPNFARNGDTPVGEYLYSLKEQQEQKIRAAADEQERKRLEDAGRGKQSQGSKTMVKALQQKRFRQIFDFLDQEGLGSFNLVALMAVMPDWLDDLDDEVRADLEMAAKLLAKRSLKHNDSGKSDASFFMPPPPSLDMGEEGGAGEGTNPSTPNATPGVVGFPEFCDLMEEVLSARRGPRTYLAPSPPRKYAPTETYKPQIDEKSKQMAAKIRPKDTPLHEYLYQESVVLSQKLNEKRARAQAEMTASCTFAPQLVSQQIVKEGRVMKGVREGTWYTHKSEGGELEGADSLQHLAAMMGEEPSTQGFDDYEPAPADADKSATAPSAAAAAAESAANAAAAAAAAITAAVEGSAEAANAAVAAPSAAEQPSAAEEASAHPKSASPKKKRDLPAGVAAQKKRQQERERQQEIQRQQELQRQQEEQLLQLQQEEEQERQAQLERLAQLQELEQQLQMFAQAEQQRYHEEQAAAMATQQQQAQLELQQGEEQADEVDDFEGSEEQRQYLELEREVQQMLEATSAAAAAAERLQSTTDQQYLSDILGLAQEQVDALAPTISHLKGLEVRTSSPIISEQPSACGSATAAAAAALAAIERQYTPKSSFKINMLEEEQAAAAAEEPQQQPQQRQQQLSKKASSKVARKASSKLIDMDDMDLFDLAGVNGPAGGVSAGVGRLIIE